MTLVLSPLWVPVPQAFKTHWPDWQISLLGQAPLGFCGLQAGLTQLPLAQIMLLSLHRPDGCCASQSGVLQIPLTQV